MGLCGAEYFLAWITAKECCALPNGFCPSAQSWQWDCLTLVLSAFTSWCRCWEKWSYLPAAPDHLPALLYPSLSAAVSSCNKLIQLTTNFSHSSVLCQHKLCNYSPTFLSWLSRTDAGWGWMRLDELKAVWELNLLLPSTDTLIFA